MRVFDGDSTSPRFSSRSGGGLDAAQDDNLSQGVASSPDSAGRDVFLRSKKRSGIQDIIQSKNAFAWRRSSSPRMDWKVSPKKFDLPDEELLKSFEEWMKLVANNKINASNSWDLALIDYFYEMSLLKEGGTINFQRASSTLDGCVKIYTSRIDSVTSETRKLLNGLLDSNKDTSDTDERKSDSPRKKALKKKHSARQTSTIEENIENLNVQKLDTELTADPLFKKTTADFDRSGAHALLLNYLNIDREGKIIIDSSDSSLFPRKELAENDFSEEISDSRVDMHNIISKFKNSLKNIEEKEVCEEIDLEALAGESYRSESDEVLSQDALSPASTYNSMNHYNVMITDQDHNETPCANYIQNMDTATPCFSQVLAEEDLENDIKSQETEDNDKIGKVLKAKGLKIDRFSYFDNYLAYNKVEEDVKFKQKNKKTVQKQVQRLNFSETPHIPLEKVISSQKSSSLVLNKKPSLNRNLAPETDIQSHIFSLFHKPEVKVALLHNNTKLNNTNLKHLSETCNSKSGYLPNPFEIVVNLDGFSSPTNNVHMQNICDKDYANIEPNLPEPLSVNTYEDKKLYPERTMRKLDSKKLKKNVWKAVISEKKLIEDQSKTNENKELLFSSVFKSLEKFYPESKKKELNFAHCFICLLDLANENNLELSPHSFSNPDNVATDLRIVFSG